MLRLIAAVIFTAIGAILGAAGAERLSESRRICERIGLLLQRLNFSVGCRGDDVFTISRRLRADPELRQLSFLQKLPVSFSPDEDFRELWRKAVKTQSGLGSEETELLVRIGGILGKTDSASQLSALGEIQNELDRLTDRRTEELHRKGRLYRSAGVLLGAMAGIIVL